jgi:hypothetical protein
MSEAVVVPFPLARRRTYIVRQANHSLCLNPGAAARYLEHQLHVQGEAMRRRGIAEGLIARELKRMEAAIHRELLQVSLSTGDA